MENSSKVNWGLSRRSTLIGGICLAVVSAVAALAVCSARVELKRQLVLEDYGSAVTAWLDSSSSAAELWSADLKEQRLRVSEAETYRLFAGDMFGLDSAVADRISQSTGEGELGQGFTGDAAVLSEEVPAIRRILKEYMDSCGLHEARIVNASGLTLLSAQSKPAALSSLQREGARRAVASGSTVALPVRADSSGLVLDVFEPVIGLDSPARPVAAFLSTRPVLADFTQFSARPKPEELAEALFLQRNAFAPAPQWESLVAPRPKVLSVELSGQLEAGHGALPLGLRASAGSLGEVYSAAYPVPGTDWAVMLETPAAVLEQRIFHATLPIYAACGLGWAAFMLLCLLVWWVSAGRQQKALTAELAALHQLVSRQKELLDSVNISLDEGLFMADVKGCIHVCNRAFARLAGSSEDALRGQILINCLPLEAASALVERIRNVAIRSEGDSFELWLTPPAGQTAAEAASSSANEARLYRVTLFPFLDSSGASMRESLRGAVVTMKDITEFRRRSERARQQQKRLIEAFTSVEASADPYLYGHSLRMAELGERVAAALGLSEDGRNTVVMGAQLSQLGKLFIPRELLTKTERLTPEELAEVRRAPEHAARVLGSVDFDLPIARALHEMYENMDGSGYPRGLSGEAILPEARLLAVLNAYCAMVSDRAYRKGMHRAEALAQLRDPAKFDQTMVDALEKVLAEGK